MAYLAINGYELPPCKRGVKVTVTTVVNSGRDANRYNNRKLGT